MQCAKEGCEKEAAEGNKFCRKHMDKAKRKKVDKVARNLTDFRTVDWAAIRSELMACFGGEAEFARQLFAAYDDAELPGTKQKYYQMILTFFEKGSADDDAALYNIPTEDLEATLRDILEKEEEDGEVGPDPSDSEE